MRFAEPGLLWWLALVIPLLLFVYISAFRRKRRALQRFGHPALMEKIADLVTIEQWAFQTVLITGGSLFALLALARPQWGVRLQAVESRGVDIIVAVDTSASMLVEDLTPDRLTRSRHEVTQGLERLRNNRIGLLSFARSAYLQCPLTLDHRAIRMFLDIIDTRTIPRQGTDIQSAIDLAVDSFPGPEKKHKAMILFTDGENQEGDPLAAAQHAREAGVIVHVVGLGSPQGAPIPLRDKEGRLLDYKRDSNGQIVMSRLDEPLLKEIAERGGGLYLRAESERFVIPRITREINRMDQRTFQSTMQQRFNERFQYALFPALLLILVETIISRRGKRRHGVGRF